MGIIGLISKLNIKDFIDIFIVTLLVYQLLLIVRGTKAAQMVMGLVFLFLLSWAGITFKLHSLNWVLAHFFDSFFIIVVVLFQDQFRNALASVGTKKNFTYAFLGFWDNIYKPRKSPVDFDEIVEACAALSRENIGALIAITREQGLLNYVNTGTKLDARIHSDLLYAIFESKSSLHDGAIIIDDRHILSAGSFLPLSKNFDIERHLGTRHRAALGLTEITDAVVITVSEETGRINVCVGGNFYLCKTEVDLGLYLRHLWMNEELPGHLKPIKSKDIIS